MRLTVILAVLFILSISLSPCEAYNVLQLDSEIFSVGGKLAFFLIGNCNDILVCGLNSSNIPAILRVSVACKQLIHTFACRRVSN